MAHNYEALLGETINAVSFRRKMDELTILQAVPSAPTARTGRPSSTA